MIVQNIEIANVQEVKLRLGSLKSKAPTVMCRAVNDAVSKAFTETKRSIAHDYHITQKNVAPHIQKIKANKSSLKGAISAKGERISLYKFKFKNGNPISAAVLGENGPKQLNGDPKAFIAVMKNEHEGIFVRKGLYKKKRKKMEYGKKRKVNAHNEQIRQLFGPSVPQMMKNETVMDHIRAEASETLQRRLEHHINYILQKG